MRTDGGSNKKVGVPHITKAGQQLSCQRGEQARSDRRGRSSQKQKGILNSWRGPKKPSAGYARPGQ